MKRLALFCLLTTALCISAKAQYHISVHTGLGTFQMKSLKQFQKEVASSSPVLLKESALFPPFFHFGGSFVYEYSPRLGLGAAIEYGSSGSRFDYRDYSGYVQYDQLTNYWQVSFSTPYRNPLGSSKFSLILDGLPGITYTNLNLNFREKVGTSESSETIKFHSINVHAQPTITIIRALKNFEIGLYSGFCVNVLKGKLLWSEDTDAHLLDDSGDIVNSDWSGFRTGVRISYRIE